MACGAMFAAMTLMAATEKVGAYTWTYEITDGEAAIYGTSSGGSSTPCVSPAPTDAVKIPATLGGKPVTRIKPWAFNGCSGMTSVLIPGGVKRIDSYAFYECSGLTSLMLPDSVTNIAGYAFVDCTGLKEVTIPCSVATIGNYAFKGCSGLESTALPVAFETAENLDKIFLDCPRNVITWQDVNVKVEGDIAWACMVYGGGAVVGGGANDRAIPVSTSGDIAIPSKLGGYTVTAIQWMRSMAAMDSRA